MNTESDVLREVAAIRKRDVDRYVTYRIDAREGEEYQPTTGVAS